jgi:hypothetical protein
VEQQKLYWSVLHEAAQAVGGATLAAFLGVEPRQLGRWLGGAEIPLGIFLASLDIIADGPFAPREAPARVAAIREGVEQTSAAAWNCTPVHARTDTTAGT